jgi:excisionase family DNA binding protein
VKTKPSFVTPNEVARALRVSKMTVYREIHQGRIAAVRVGRGFRILESEMDRYIVDQATVADWPS